MTDYPVDVISMDEAGMLVDAVVNHQCPLAGKDKSTVGKWILRVRFVGCGPDEVSGCRLPRPTRSSRSTSTLTSILSQAWLKKGSVMDHDWQLAS